jgi:hypothetical protein
MMLVVVDHYSKWCETRVIKSHDVMIVVRFLEEEVVCYFGVAKYVLINNGNDWMKEFDALCQDYRIVHQFIISMWP